MVQDLRVQGLRFKIRGLGIRDKELKFRVCCGV
jgi:hypothetical protein